MQTRRHRRSRSRSLQLHRPFHLHVEQFEGRVVLAGTVGLEADPADATKTALVVTGTSGDDTIVLQAASGRAVRVIFNSANRGTFSPTGQIMVNAGSGNDKVVIGRGITRAATLNGGPGNDTLTGGGGNDFIDGGGGNDTLRGGGGDDVVFGRSGVDSLFGGPGKDILSGGDDNDRLEGGVGIDLLLGGLGSDSLLGQGGDDLLISDTTSYDTDPTVLKSILQEWADPKLYGIAIDRLGRGSEFGLPKLDATTVFDDPTAVDKLVGGSGADWFLATGGLDTTPDLAKSERITSAEALVNRGAAAENDSDPDVAVAPGGQSVVVWRRGQETENAHDAASPPGIKAQFYNAFGNRLGPPIYVESGIDRLFDRPAVAVDAAGNATIAWTVRGEPNDELFVRRYTAAGRPRGPAVLVYSAAGVLDAPDIAADAAGNCVVVWRDTRADAGDSGIYAQRYDAAGAAVGGVFRVNAISAGAQQEPAVAMAPSGAFAISWHVRDKAAPGNGDDIFARRWSAAGVPLDVQEFSVNTTTAGNQRFSAVAAGPDGSYVFAWYGAGQDGDGEGVYARRFGVGGEPLTGEIAVNSTTKGNQLNPAVAVGQDGRFVVCWQGLGNGDRSGIFAQRFDATGVRLGNQFRLNARTANVQTSPSIGVDKAGNLLAAWDSFNQAGPSTQFDVFCQRFPVTAGNQQAFTDTRSQRRGPVVQANAYARGVSASPTQDIVPIPNLAPLETPPGEVEPDPVDFTSFVSRQPTPANGVTFAVLGDWGYSFSKTLGQDDGPVDYVGYMVRSWHPDFILGLGDTNYLLGLTKEFDENTGKNYAPYMYPYVPQETYGNDYPTSIPGTPPNTYNRFFGVPGNHDYHDPFTNSKNVLASRADYDAFYMPSVTGSQSSANVVPLAGQYVSSAPFNLAGSGGNPFYDYRFSPIDATGTVHPDLANFYMIDGYQAAIGNADGSSLQAQTILADAATRPGGAAWQLGADHFQPFSSSGGIQNMQWNFAGNKFDAFLAGHLHNYERILTNGFTYVVNGIGGYDFPIETFSPFNNPPLPGSVARVTQVFGAMLVTMTPTTLTFETWALNPGDLESPPVRIDSTVLTKASPDATPMVGSL